MKCELNIRGREFGPHDARAAWIAKNRFGSTFRMCNDCVVAYKKNKADWEKRGVKFEPIKRSVHATV